MDENKSIQVVYVFSLPEHEYELKQLQNCPEMFQVIDDIYQACRRKWKYDLNANEETITFAHEIGNMISEAGVLHD